ncbi:MAG: NAD(P)/FAD-dependent oxidoreductase [Solirubrobacterales bacterium]
MSFFFNQRDPAGAAVSQTKRTKVLIIGGGYSGIGAAIRLKKSGIDDFILIDKAHKLGGTWRENTYPMAGADTPSIIYSFSFARNPDWDYTFALQPQIEKYLDDTADRFGVTPHAQFNTEATMGDWDDEAGEWNIETSQGTIRAKYVIACAGPMHEAAFPDIPGVEKFAGEAFHTAKWDHSVDLAGKRVAVIGTGASAIQYVPVIQKQVGELILFQRTAPWVMPRMNRRARPWKKAMYRRLPWVNQLVADLIYAGSECLQLLERRPARMKLLEQLGRWNIRRSASDPALVKQLTPTFAMGCKRILFSNEWYPAITANNSTIVSEGVREVDATGLVDQTGAHHDVDVIIYSTGFKVTDPDIAKRVRGRTGELLADHWQGSPFAYQTVAVHGYPNAFVLLGPNVGNGHGSVTTLVELLSDYIVKGIEAAEAVGAKSVEVDQRIQEIWNSQVQDSLRGTVWNDGGCSSYYIDATGRNSAIYPWTTIRFRRETERFDLGDYVIVPAETTNTEPEKETVAA